MSMEVQYLVVTDLETTGVRASDHEIIQIARVMVDLTIPKVLTETLWSTYVKPTNWRRRSIKAMEVNRLTRDFLNAEGVDLKEALIEYSTGVPWNNALLAAWGADFEKDFLEQSFRKVDRANPINYRAECIRSWAHLKTLGGGSRKLPSLGEACEEAGILFDYELAHDAAYDTLQTAHLAVSLIEELKWNRS